MSDIQSIANGTFVLGQTSATNFVGGPGITVDSPSEGTVRISNDETILWEGVMSATGVTAYLNYPATKFNKIKIYAYPNISFSGQRPQQIKEFVPGTYTGTNNFYYVKTDNIESNLYYGEIIYLSFGTNNDFTLSPGCRWQGNTYTTGINTYRGAVTKIVGINRISGGNA